MAQAAARRGAPPARAPAISPALAPAYAGVAAALTGVILAAGGVIGMIQWSALSLLLARLPHSCPEIVRYWLLRLVSGDAPTGSPLGVPDGPAQRIERENAAAWTALYLVAASERLAAAASEDRLPQAEALETRYWRQHLAAEARRIRAAALVDMAAHLNADRPGAEAGLLGWYARLDYRTTPECRAANGKNFVATQMPLIGWPGAVHVSCRCTPGPPHADAALIPSA